MRGKIGLHDGLQRCNAQRAALACVGEGSREYLLPFGGMPGMSRADALHYIRTGIGTKQRRHRNKGWKAL